MSHPIDNADRLLDLTGAVCNRTASQEDLLELDSILHADPTARSDYFEYCWIHAAVRLQLRAQSAAQRAHRQILTESAVSALHHSPSADTQPMSAGVSRLPSIAIRGATGFFSSGWPVAYLIATVIFGIGLAIGALVHVSQPPDVVRHPASLPSPLSPLPSAVARITGMVDCEWEGSGFRVQGSGDGTKDSPLSTLHSPLIHLGDRLVLKSGLLELTYDTGAKVILQGPVTYEVESPTSGYLSVGKLTAKLEKRSAVSRQPSDSANQKSEILNHKSPDLCPLTSDLFAIRTPTAVVTDLGTEFGVEVNEEGNTVSHVFHGIVEVQPIARNGQRGQPIRLTENESVRVEKQQGSKGTTVHYDAADAAAFVRVGQLPELAKELRLKPFRRWQAHSQELRKDPSLLAYYDFQQKPGEPSVLPNVAANGGNSLDGLVVNAAWVDGRMAGKHALLFQNPSNSVRINLPQKTDNLTLAACVYVDSLDNPVNSLLMSNGWKPGLICWHVRADGRIGFGVNGWRVPYSVSEREFDRARFFQWTHLALVYDRDVARVRLYVDGQLSNESPVPQHTPICIGPASIGRWDPVDRNDSPKVRNFRGKIDELVLFRRALTADQVQEMYEAGAPPRKPQAK